MSRFDDWIKLIPLQSPISARQLNSLASAVRGLTQSLPANSFTSKEGTVTRPRSGAGGMPRFGVLKLIAGPDIRWFYTARLQKTTAIISWTSDVTTHFEDSTDATSQYVYFVGLGEAAATALPGADHPDEPWHDKYCWAYFEGIESSGNHVWQVYDFASAAFGLIVDPEL